MTQAPQPSAVAPDWTREHRQAGQWQPSRALLASIRTYQRHAGRTTGLAWLARKCAVIRHRFWSVVCGSDIPLNCQLGGGLILPHPQGVVIHPDVQLGPNCMVFQQVTLGTGPKPGVPCIGGHVDIGPGARVLGGVTVGDHARIGANAVVLEDVPAGATAVGVPARIKCP